MSRVESVVGVIEDQVEPDVPELLERSEALGFETVRFRSIGRISSSAISQIRDFVRRERINVLHTHGYKTDIVGLLAVLGTGCQLVTTPHGWTEGPDLKLRVYEWLDRLAFFFMDAVVPLSPRLYTDTARWLKWRRNVFLIRNGVDVAEIDAAAPHERSIEHAADENGLIVGYIGRLVPGKRVEDLVRAFAALDVEDKQLWIVGDGPERANIESAISSHSLQSSVRLFGYRDDRLSLLKSFDVFVLPSLSEGIPRCLLEAMAARVPVVATDIPGCRNLVEDAETGLLYAPGDAAALQAALQALVSDPGRAASIVTRARDFVLQEYSAERMALEYTDLYYSLVMGGAGSKGVQSLDGAAQDE
jgi:glycosyltransferase involved in cell wall biosynthesis